MGDKCRNCNSCAYFPCNYYNQFNVDRNIGCIDWADEIKQTFISNNTNDYEIENNLEDKNNDK